jgi:leader peptidase (prepilin peptidase)/N-methyltransferase
VVAAVAAVLGAVAAAGLADPYQIAVSAFLAATMGTIAVEDVRRMRVPDAWNLAAAIGGFVAVGLEAQSSGTPPLIALGHAAVSMIVCGGIFFLIREIFFRLRGVEGLGFGDVKLAATGGIWLGWQVFPAVVLLAAIAAIVWIAAATLIQRAWPRERKIPFAAFLAPAIWFCWLYARVAQV